MSVLALMVMIMTTFMLTVLIIAPPPLAAQDFGRGFERLFDLGLADPAGGEYVAADLQSHHGMPWSVGMLRRELKGHGWLLPAPEGLDYPLFVTYGEHPDLLISREQFNELVGEHDDSAMLAAANHRVRTNLQRQAAAAGYRSVIGDTKPIDPAIDVRWWTELLEDDERWQELFAGFGTDPAQLFSMAACWHRQGETDLAARLAGRVLADADSPASVLQAVTHQIADNHYAAAMARLRVGAADWQQTEDTLRDLLQRFNRGWTKAQAVEILADRMQQRIAAGDEAPPLDPQLADEPSAEALAWWRQLDELDFPSQNDHSWYQSPRQITSVGRQLLVLWINGMSWHDAVSARQPEGTVSDTPVSAL